MVTHCTVTLVTQSPNLHHTPSPDLVTDGALMLVHIDPFPGPD